MNAFEKGLSRPIPLEKAASYFVGLKRFRGLPPEDDALMAAAVKTASTKTALDEEGTPGSGSMASPSPADVPPEDEYLSNEQQGLEAENANAIAFYQQKLEQARAEAAMAQEQAQTLQQQVDALTGTQGDHESQLAAHQQEGQIAQQAALQQVQAANQKANEALTAAVDAENRALEARGQEAAAKIEQQKLRSQLFGLAEGGLPGTEPELGGAGNAAEGLSPALPPAPAGDGSGGTAPSESDVQGQDPAAAAAGGEGAPAADPSQQEEPAAAEGIPGQETSPGVAGAAAPAPVAAPGIGVSGAGPGQPPRAPGEAEGEKKPGVSIKVGADRYQRLLARRAPLEDRAAEDRALQAKIAAGLPEYLRRPEILGALAGGVAGAGAAGIEAAGGGPDLDVLRGRISDNEGAAARPGLRGFAKALELAKDRALLTLGEATQQHPVAATITGGLLGAGVGHAAGPRLADKIREAISLHKGM